MYHHFWILNGAGYDLKTSPLYSKNKAPRQHKGKNPFFKANAFSIQLHLIELYIFQPFRRKSGMEFACLYEIGNSRYIAFKLGIWEETPEGYWK